MNIFRSLKVIAVIIAVAVGLLTVQGVASARTTSPPPGPVFVCLGGSACTGGTTTIGGTKKVTVPKIPTKASTKKLTESQILAVADFVRQVLLFLKLVFKIYGETLPFYVAKALLCPTSPPSAELTCVQNSGFPQAPLTRT